MALFEINEKSSLPVWLQLKNRFIYLITSGYYKTDDQLPTVRGLAAEVGVNYNTVSKVYGSLEEDGYIVSKRRQGAFVADVSERCDMSLSAVSEGLAREYLKRCLEVGMTLDDAERQVLKTIREQRGAQADGEFSKSGGMRLVRFDDAERDRASRGA
ncbi:MAG: GntR family transcriptional regulator [Slackia sp.]|nr:GntR family transcriptional regulator [Slackia sp.]